jgi:hypothetical protein
MLSRRLRRHLKQRQLTRPYAINDRMLAARWNGEFRLLRDIKDYFRFVAQWCKSGAGLGMLNSHVANLAEKIVSVELLKRYSAKSLIKQAERWHRVVHQCNADIQAKESAASLWEWPALPGLPWHDDNVAAVALTTPELLAREGDQMNHCAANFAEHCLLGQAI